MKSSNHISNDLGAAMAAEDIDVGTKRDQATWEARVAARLAQKQKNRDKVFRKIQNRKITSFLFRRQC